MACPVHDVSVKELRRAHFTQLLAYVTNREREGWYYGNRSQFEKRHSDLIKWLDSVIELYNRD